MLYVSLTHRHGIPLCSNRNPRPVRNGRNGIRVISRRVQSYKTPIGPKRYLPGVGHRLQKDDPTGDGEDPYHSSRSTPALDDPLRGLKFHRLLGKERSLGRGQSRSWRIDRDEGNPGPGRIRDDTQVYQGPSPERGRNDRVSGSPSSSADRIRKTTGVREVVR